MTAGATADLPPRKGMAPRRLLLGGLALALLLSAAVGWWAYANRQAFRITIGGPNSTDLLAQVTGLAGITADRAGPLDHVDGDGTTPDTASRTYALGASAAAIRASVGRSCRALRLDPPDAALGRSDPAAICFGPWRGMAATVSLLTDCREQGRCRATVRAELL